MSTHVLTFTDIVGDFTVDKEMLGKQDPYIIFSVGSAKVQTKALKNIGANIARWTETYTLKEFEPSKATTLHVDVYNHNTLLPDNVIGSGTVNLASLSERQLQGSNEGLHVLLSDKKGKSTGVIKFALNGGGYVGSASSGTAAAGVAGGAAATGAAASQETGHAGRATAGEHVQTAAAKPVAATAAVSGAAGAEVDRKYFTEHEDRAEEQVLVEKFKEHRPYVQEYETTVQPTGRVREVGTHVEALGSEVRTLGAEQVQDRVDLECHLPAGSMAQRPGGEGWIQTKPGPVVDSVTFEVEGERVIDKERLTQLREHRDIEKELEVTTRVQEHEIPQATKTEVVDRHRVRTGAAAGLRRTGSNASSSSSSSSSSMERNYSSTRATHHPSAAGATHHHSSAAGATQQSSAGYGTYKEEGTV